VLALPCSFPRNCTVRLFSFRHAPSESSETKSIQTVFCPIGSAVKGYTPGLHGLRRRLFIRSRPNQWGKSVHCSVAPGRPVLRYDYHAPLDLSAVRFCLFWVSPLQTLTCLHEDSNGLIEG
jgi:hypothetical protein